jgi:D-glycero-D-manno-heptose 1,7-bisphosphate phosphatase
MLQIKYKKKFIAQDVLVYENFDLSAISYDQDIIFLDRDGVLIHDTGYISSPADVLFYEDALELFEVLNRKNFLVCIVTNQSGVGRGYFDWSQYESVTNRFISLIPAYCRPQMIIAAGCSPLNAYHPSFFYRKPGTLMLNYCINTLCMGEISSRRSFFIGDKLCDIDCAFDFSIDYIYHVKTGHGHTEFPLIHSKYAAASNIYYYDSISALLCRDHDMPWFRNIL